MLFSGVFFSTGTSHADEDRRAKTAAKLIKEGIELQSRGELKQATILFRKAVKLAPDKGGPHFFLGRALVEQGKCAAGVKELEKYLESTVDAKRVDEAARLIARCRYGGDGQSGGKSKSTHDGDGTKNLTGENSSKDSLLASASGFVTIGVLGAGLQGGYMWNRAWELRASVLLGALTGNPGGGSLQAFSVGVVRHWRRPGRVEPFIGGTANYAIFNAGGGSANAGGFLLETGVSVRMTSGISVVAMAPIGYISEPTIVVNGVATPFGGFFVGFSAGIRVRYLI